MKYLLFNVVLISDHAYTLPWTEMDEGMVIARTILTPPNSDENDSDSSEISSDQFCSSPNSNFDLNSSESSVPKFQSSRTVKLKHKKDLKFVFSSLKVKDEKNSDINDLSINELSSLINSNKSVSNLKSTSNNAPQLCKKSIYKGVSVLKRNIGYNHHNSHSSSLQQQLRTQSYHNSASSKHSSTSDLSPGAVRTISFEDDCESALAVEGIMNPESIRYLVVVCFSRTFT